MIFVYISHVYDVTFFSRLFEHAKVNSLLFNDPVYLIADRFKNNNHIIRETKKTTPNIIILGPTTYKLTKLYTTTKSIRSIKRTINRYSNGNDCFFTTDKSKFISKILLNYFDKSILIQQKEEISENFKRELFKEAKRNLIHFLFQACPANYYKSRDAQGQIYFQRLTSCRATVIYHSNDARFSNRIWIQRNQHNHKLRKRVLILGSRYMAWSFVTRDGIKNKILETYKSLYGIYSDYSYIYIPHPRETGSEIAELSKIIHNMTVVRPHISAESYLHSDTEFAFSISIGSTASISTYMNGIPSFVFFRSLNMPVGIAKTYELICDPLPDLAHISSLKKMKQLLCTPMQYPSTYFPSEIKDLMVTNSSIT